MGLHRELDALHPTVAAAAKLALAELTNKGVKYFINETYREQIVQDAYYSKGRESLDVVNAKYKAAGLYAVTAADNKKICTKAKKSEHTKRLALDIYPMSGDTILRNAEKGKWDQIADSFRKYGFEWGGDWGDDFIDYPHFQYKGVLDGDSEKD